MVFDLHAPIISYLIRGVNNTEFHYKIVRNIIGRNNPNPYSAH